MDGRVPLRLLGGRQLQIGANNGVVGIQINAEGVAFVQAIGPLQVDGGGNDGFGIGEGALKRFVNPVEMDGATHIYECGAADEEVPKGALPHAAIRVGVGIEPIKIPCEPIIEGELVGGIPIGPEGLGHAQNGGDAPADMGAAPDVMPTDIFSQHILGGVVELEVGEPFFSLTAVGQQGQKVGEGAKLVDIILVWLEGEEVECPDGVGGGVFAGVAAMILFGEPACGVLASQDAVGPLLAGGFGGEGG